MDNCVQGRVVAERYRLSYLLGRGGGGEVWAATHLDMGTTAAVKLLHNPEERGSEDLARFKREARAAASLRCENVVQVFDYGIDDGTPYIAMELLEGESLASRMETQGPLPAEETTQLLSQVARALELAHSRGIIHRDLKPDNIFLCDTGTERTAKILDFGIAKAQLEKSIEDDLSTRTGTILGTPMYMSLEQLLGDKTVDHRTDIWAFGVIACECLTGKKPFRAETLGNLIVHLSSGDRTAPSELGAVPEGFDEWFESCTARRLEERFESIRDAADRLCDLNGMTLVRSSKVPSSATSSAAHIVSAPTISSSTYQPSSTRHDDRSRWTPRSKLLMVGLGGLLTLAIFGRSWLRQESPATGRPSTGEAPVSVSAEANPAAQTDSEQAIAAPSGEEPHLEEEPSEAEPTPKAEAKETIPVRKDERVTPLGATSPAGAASPQAERVPDESAATLPSSRDVDEEETRRTLLKKRLGF